MDKSRPVMFIFAVVLFAAGAAFPSGVVFEDGDGGAGHVVGWMNAEGKRGEIKDIADYYRVKFEVKPPDEADLIVETSGVERVVDFGDVEVRPDMDEVLTSEYEAVLIRMEEDEGDFDKNLSALEEIAGRCGNLESWWIYFRAASKMHNGARYTEAEKLFDLSAERAMELNNPFPAAISKYYLGSASYELSEYDKAEEYYTEALNIYKNNWTDSFGEAYCLSGIAHVMSLRDELDGAEKLYLEALEIRRKRAPETLEIVKSYRSLTVLEWRRSRYDKMEEYGIKSIELIEKIKPGSGEHALNLHNMGLMYAEMGVPEKARDYYERSIQIQKKIKSGGRLLGTMYINYGNMLVDFGEIDRAGEVLLKSEAILEKTAPESIDMAICLNALGILYWEKGDLTTAEDYLTDSMVLKQNIYPESLEVAKAYLNLGNVAWYRRNMAAAEKYYRSAMAIQEKVVPDSLEYAAITYNLSVLLGLRGEHDLAGRYLKKALEIYRKHSPESLQVAKALQALGSDALNIGDTESARNHYEEALKLYERVSPGNLDISQIYKAFGDIAQMNGNPEEAEKQYLKALDFREEKVPMSLYVAETCISLGYLYAGRDKPGKAEKIFRKALDISSALPGSITEARALHALGSVKRHKGALHEAAKLMERACAALETQMGRLGGTEEVQAEFRSRYMMFYRDYIEVLHEMGRDEDAFHVLERSRARMFLSMLAERDLDFSADISREQDVKRRGLEKELSDAMNRLGGISPGNDAGEYGKVKNRIEELKLEIGNLEEEIKRNSPRFAALKYPEPLTLEEARESLPAGTLLLAYSVGEFKTMLFILGPGKDDYAVREIPAGYEELFRETRRFRLAVKTGADVRPAAMELSGILLGPAARNIKKADRLLISPDGPLNFIPFDGLADPVKKRFRYLAERMPVHSVISMTVYLELRKDSGERTTESVAAMGDPFYDVPEEHRPFPAGQCDIAPLPASRKEIRNIERIYEKSATVWLGEEATEERARALNEKTDIIHFACHGVIDEVYPLDSALVLTLPGAEAPGDEDGLLRAWEVFEDIRIDSYLVVLSACETGLGKELGGEGLIGLTRAFQYAGAESVIASLWKVPDESTSVLMAELYRHLKKGSPKDEALRKAKLRLLRKPVETDNGPVDAFHPYYWSGFQLIGNGE